MSMTTTFKPRRPNNAEKAWVERHGININIVPADGIDITPREHDTLIEWSEYAIGEDGETILNDTRDDLIRTGVKTKILPEVALFTVKDGMVIHA